MICRSICQLTYCKKSNLFKKGDFCTHLILHKHYYIYVRQYTTIDIIYRLYSIIIFRDDLLSDKISKLVLCRMLRKIGKIIYRNTCPQRRIVYSLYFLSPSCKEAWMCNSEGCPGPSPCPFPSCRLDCKSYHLESRAYVPRSDCPTTWSRRNSHPQNCCTQRSTIRSLTMCLCVCA